MAFFDPFSSGYYQQPSYFYSSAVISTPIEDNIFFFADESPKGLKELIEEQKEKKRFLLPTVAPNQFLKS